MRETPRLRVIDYINKADPAEAIAAHAEAYNVAPSLELWARFRDEMNARVLVNTTMQVVLTHVIKKWSEHPGCGEDDDYIEVSGRDSEGRWSLSFTDWSDWKGMEVFDETDLNLTVPQIAAHLFYESTWHGFPEDMIARRDEILDRAEALKGKIG